MPNAGTVRTPAAKPAPKAPRRPQPGGERSRACRVREPRARWSPQRRRRRAATSTRAAGERRAPAPTVRRRQPTAASGERHERERRDSDGRADRAPAGAKTAGASAVRRPPTDRRSLRQRRDFLVPLRQQARALGRRSVLGEVVVDELDLGELRRLRRRARRSCSTAPGRTPSPARRCSALRDVSAQSYHFLAFSMFLAPLMMLMLPIS